MSIYIYIKCLFFQLCSLSCTLNIELWSMYYMSFLQAKQIYKEIAGSEESSSNAYCL